MTVPRSCGWVSPQQTHTPDEYYYREALDEALCFGWIDGVRKSIDQTTYKQRFTPRKPKSYWSAVNTRRAGELAKLGRMAPAGLKAFEQRASDAGKYSFESRPKKLPAPYEKRFKANPAAWEFFRKQAPWYQRTSSFGVVSAKQEGTRQRRLATLIRDSEDGRRLGMLTPKVKKPQHSENRSCVTAYSETVPRKGQNRSRKIRRCKLEGKLELPARQFSTPRWSRPPLAV